MVEVTQADRKAAAKLVKLILGADGIELAVSIESGHEDNRGHVQIVAKHRLAQSLTPDASGDTDVDIAEGRRLLAAATTGPWHHVPICFDHELVEDRIVMRHPRGPATIVVQDVTSSDDAKLLVWLRNNAEALLAALQRSPTIEQAVAEERARIIAWLRKRADEVYDAVANPDAAPSDPLIAVMAYTHGYANDLEEVAAIRQGPTTGGDDATP